MSEQVLSQEVGENPSENSEVDRVSEMERQLGELRASNTRLLNESKSNKEKRQELENQLKAERDRKLEEEGKLSERLESEKSRNQELTSKLKLQTETILAEKLRNGILKLAPKCKDVDLVMKLSQHKDRLVVDKDSLVVDKIEDFINAARESHPFLFEENRLPNTETDRPNNPDVSKKPLTEFDRWKEELKKQTSQEKLDKFLLANPRPQKQ